MRQAINFIARSLWRWDVTGIGSTLIYGFGVGAMYGDDYIVAGVLYFVGTAWLTARILAWEETKAHPQRGLVSTGILVAATLILGGSGFWIRHRAIMHAAEKREASSTKAKNEPEEKKEPPKTENSLTQAKKEPPKDESLPATKKKSPAKPAGKSESPAFAVAVEVKLMVPGPSKDTAGTGFWGLSTSGRNCYLRSADVVMLIRIKSLEPIKTMITAYNVYGIGGELSRIKMTNSTPVWILGRGLIPANFTGTLILPIPTGSGNANAGFVTNKFADTDFSVAAVMHENVLDKEIAHHYLEPGDTVRGWAFFEYPVLASLPVKLILKISDDLGHTFSFEIPDEPGNPSGDALRKEFVLSGPPMNLSPCIRQPHPAPSP